MTYVWLQKVKSEEVAKVVEVAKLCFPPKKMY